LLRQLLEAGARHELKCGTEGEVKKMKIEEDSRISLCYFCMSF